MRRCRVTDVPIPQWNIFIVRPVSAVRPSSVADNLRGRYHKKWGCDMLLYMLTRDIDVSMGGWNTTKIFDRFYETSIFTVLCMKRSYHMIIRLIKNTASKLCANIVEKRTSPFAIPKSEQKFWKSVVRNRCIKIFVRKIKIRFTFLSNLL